jgi:hypothetical protein
VVRGEGVGQRFGGRNFLQEIKEIKEAMRAPQVTCWMIPSGLMMNRPLEGVRLGGRAGPGQGSAGLRT